MAVPSMKAMMAAGGGGGGSIPSSPVAGSTLWLDADDAATFSYHSGVLVNQWSDKSGNGNHVVSTASGSAPSRNGTQNGRTSVVFASTKEVHCAAFAVINDFSIFVAGKRTGGSTTVSLPVQNGSGTTGYGPLWRANSGNVGYIRQGIQFHSSTTPDPAAASVLTVRRRASQWVVHLDGADVGLTATGFAPNMPSGSFFVGASGANNFVGEIYEVLVYLPTLSDADHILVEDYLAAKWGTP
jgi:hypothetical protein